VIRSQGVSGSFKGNLMNILYFSVVPYHALVYSQNSPVIFGALLMAFEGVFYPIDTLRTYLYADVQRSHKNVLESVKETFEKGGGVRQFYKGLGYKQVYNAVFATNLWAYYTKSDWIYATGPLWALSYALLTLKTRAQLTGSALSFQKAGVGRMVLNIARNEGVKTFYKGLVPFLLLNSYFMYNLPQLFSEEVKKEKLMDIAQHIEHEYSI